MNAKYACVVGVKPKSKSHKVPPWTRKYPRDAIFAALRFRKGAAPATKGTLSLSQGCTCPVHYP